MMSSSLAQTHLEEEKQARMRSACSAFTSHSGGVASSSPEAPGRLAPGPVLDLYSTPPPQSQPFPNYINYATRCPAFLNRPPTKLASRFFLSPILPRPHAIKNLTQNSLVISTRYIQKLLVSFLADF